MIGRRLVGDMGEHGECVIDLRADSKSMRARQMCQVYTD